MNEMSISKPDEITMRLVHYFVTKENYQPIIVNGLDNEIWLENLDKDYSVIRINGNYIHNKEQLDFDKFKASTVIKQIKRKTLSLNMNYLTILLNVNDDVEVTDAKHNKICKIDEKTDINKALKDIFPAIKEDKISSDDAMDFFINVTNDINKSTEERNKLYENTFSKKVTFITYLLIAINVAIYFLQMSGVITSSKYGMNAELVAAGEYYRLFTSAFLHGGMIHLLCNMYSLYIIGTQLETVLGKVKFLIVYFISIITSSLLSGVINGSSVMSVGASGAIFGLLGALLYFGYHYRLYLGNAILYQILPVICINLFIGFSTPGIDNFAHLGGLIGGYLAGMIVGVNGRPNTADRVNGVIVSTLLIAFLTYMLLFR
jgi:membrane associated rhomboid family serine protease